MSTSGIPRDHDLHATSLSAAVLVLESDFDGLDVMLDSMTPEELRHVAKSAVHNAFFFLIGGGLYTPTPEQIDELIVGMRAKIAELRQLAMG